MSQNLVIKGKYPIDRLAPLESVLSYLSNLEPSFCCVGHVRGGEWKYHSSRANYVSHGNFVVTPLQTSGATP